ncbi:MAG: IS200/IS605 family accessory protein TnpB-related protein [Thaumarchaeota archaeon]|nr:IS200/IS605 family accessory protein TnpB-related protein [Nitrososphaerota archaeon]
MISRLVAEIVVWAREHGAEAFAIEDLDIRGSRSFGRKANRVIYAFVRRKFVQNLLTRCWKEGCPVGTVNPAYTSKIGDAKYREIYGLSVHEAAALCIGRRYFGHGERLEEPVTMIVGRRKPRERVSVRYVWPSIYSYQHHADSRMEPPGRKGGAGERRSAGNEAVFTGRLTSEMTPLSESDEGVRKGGECGESPQATGDGVEPAPSQDGGKVAAGSSMRDDRQKTNPKKRLSAPHRG